ncbi:MAG: hypothetical protein QOC56_1592 [Alphaproteobacteria bacterium]|nr:hypothetical protein [Alphaproteobacteria bacterium]
MNLDPGERPFNMRSLLRLAVWGTAATGALAVAVLSAYSNTGSQRLLVAMAPAGSPGKSQAQQQSPQPPSAQLLARAAETENETRRLAEAVRTLNSDRDRLLTRIASLERSLEDVTGSIRRQAAPPPAPATPPLPPVASVTSPPPTPAPHKPTLPAGEPAPPPGEPPATTTVTAAEPAKEGPAAAKPKAQFAVDIGGAVNFDGLRVLWSSTKATNAALFEGVQPIYATRENKSRGIELRLIVGPFTSAESATRVCAALAALRRYCQPAAFEGQQLSLLAPEPERRPVVAPQIQPQRPPAPPQQQRPQPARP